MVADPKYDPTSYVLNTLENTENFTKATLSRPLEPAMKNAEKNMYPDEASLRKLHELTKWSFRIKLDKRDLENIKNYRYKTDGLTPVEVYVFEPFWNFVANNLLPDSLAPNLLTLMGLIGPVIVLIAVLAHDMTFTAILPNWVFLLGVAGLFWF